jgi:hypothetical protein
MRLLNHIDDLFFLSGTFIAAWGIDQIYEPAAYIFVGMILMFLGARVARKGGE